MASVRVSEKYAWVVARHVDEGQGVAPGAPLVDIMTPAGVVETLYAQGWGVIGHVEGKRIAKSIAGAEAANDAEYLPTDDGSDMVRYNRDMCSVFGKGDVVCHIVARPQQGTKKAGLHPCRSTAMRLRRELGI